MGAIKYKAVFLGGSFYDHDLTIGMVYDVEKPTKNSVGCYLFDDRRNRRCKSTEYFKQVNEDIVITVGDLV